MPKLHDYEGVSPAEPEDVELALNMAQAIQYFRNEPALFSHLAVVDTEGYTRLCRTWEAFVRKYPNCGLGPASLPPGAPLARLAGSQQPPWLV